jgi:hypothetical protein
LLHPDFLGKLEGVTLPLDEFRFVILLLFLGAILALYKSRVGLKSYSFSFCIVIFAV